MAVKVTRNKESLRNCHREEELKETGQPNVTWYLGRNPGIENEHQVKRKIYFKGKNSHFLSEFARLRELCLILVFALH